MSKRLKIQKPDTAAQGSKVFSPFRTIGLVSNKIPFSVTTLGQSFVITTVVGRSFQIFDASNLNLLFVSQPQTDSDIQCIYSHFHYVVAATKTSLGVYKRAALVNSVDLGLNTGESVKRITSFGEFLCACTDSRVLVYKWDPKANSIESYTQLTVSQLLGPITSMTHPPTYLNKLIVATESSLVLFNVKTGRLIHSFDEVPSGIAFVETCPVALDIVAAVAKNGDVHIYNIRTATSLMTFQIGEPITTLSFRTDSASMFGVGSANGDLFFYDMNLQRRVHSVRGLHKGSVTKIEFLASQPIVVSSGTDNVLYELVFDPPVTQSTAITPPPRILRHRGGHSRPPSTIAFTDTESHFLLSGSLDQSLWAFSLRKDAQSHQFSQRQTGKLKQKSQISRASPQDKFPPIIDLAYESVKQKQWDNILTAHKGESFARTWSGKRGIVGAFQLPTIDGSLAKCVGISNCGNFGFVGSANGGVSGFNMQSGLIRKRLPKAHESAITGICSDPTNTTIFTTSLDGKLKLWEFKSLKLVKELKMGSAVSKMRYHPGSGLLALVLDTMSIVVVDTITHKKVREFAGHANRITDLDFTPDGRWIISGSLDNTIRTWDIPTGGCIDGVKVANAVTCLRVSPDNEWLATSHIMGVGVSLWTMKSQFYNVSTRNIRLDEIQAISMPNVAGEGSAGLLDGALEDQPRPDDVEVDYENWDPPQKVASELETLSVQPRHKFNMLVHIDEIKERNKPKEKPKAPEKLPFFLGLPKSQEDQQEAAVEHFTAPVAANGNSMTFSNYLAAGGDEFADYLAGLGPAGTDIELRTMMLEPRNELVLFIDAMIDQLQKRRNFELVQAWMKMILTIHADAFVEGDSDTKAALARWQAAEKDEVARMQALSRFCSGVIKYLRVV